MHGSESYGNFFTPIPQAQSADISPLQERQGDSEKPTAQPWWHIGEQQEGKQDERLVRPINVNEHCGKAVTAPTQVLLLHEMLNIPPCKTACSDQLLLAM